MKTCTKCSEIKPLEAFSKNKSKKDGVNCYCKDCSNEAVKQWRKDNPEAFKKSRVLATKRRNDGLSDWYLKKLLSQKGLKHREVPQELIDLKREQLSLQRLAKSLQQAAKKDPNDPVS